jgi:hypothetical protein
MPLVRRLIRKSIGNCFGAVDHPRFLDDQMPSNVELLNFHHRIRIRVEADIDGLK